MPLIRHTALTLALTSSLAISGCLSAGKSVKLDPIPYDKVSYRIPNPKVMPGKIGHRERILTGVFTSEPRTFNAVMASELNSQYALTYLYDQLVDSNPKTGAPEPGLAESWSVSPDNKTFIFTLREGLKWSDGQPLTADDVVFTFNDIVANPKIPDNQFVDSCRIDGKFPVATKLDDRRVKFTLPRIFGPFITTIAGSVYILPKHQWEPLVHKMANDGRPQVYKEFNVDCDVSQLVGSGPYTLADYAPNQRIILNRNPYYAYRVDGEHHALPYADQLMLLITQDFTGEILKMTSKQADFALEMIRPRYYQTLKRLEKTGGFTCADGGTDFGTFFISLNLNRDKGANGQPYVPLKKQRWFQNVHFRHALSQSLDRQTIIDNLVMHLGSPAFTPLSPSNPYYNPQVPKYGYDLDMARAELKAGGFHWDAQGDCLDDQGNKVEFDLLVYSESPNSIPLGNILKEDLKRIGITLNVKPVLFNVIVEKSEHTLDFDSFIMGFSGAIEPNLGANMWTTKGRSHMFNMHLSKGTSYRAPNYPWEDRVDQIFRDATATLDEKKRHQLYAEWQSIIAEQLPVIHVYDQTAFYAYRTSMQNAQPTALAATLMYHPFVTPGQYFMQ